MKYSALLNRLQKMSPDQLSQPVVLLEGCSGNWTEITAVYVAPKDLYAEEEAPGERRHQEFVAAGLSAPEPQIKKGAVYIMHDH